VAARGGDGGGLKTQRRSAAGNLTFNDVTLIGGPAVTGVDN